MPKLETPDITPAQGSAVAGLLTILVGAHAAGLDGADFRTLAVCLTALAIAVVIADALIRRGRAAIAANHAWLEDADHAVALDAAGTLVPFPTPDGPA